MKLPHYLGYKSSGVEWLGEIPEHWSMSRLGYETWVRARLGWKGLKAEEYVEDGYAFLSTPNIKGKCIDFDDVNYITKERYDESPEIKLAENDVLLAKDGSTLGTVNVVRELKCASTVNSSIAVITPARSLDGIFLYYLMRSDFIQNTIQRIKGGMGVPHLFQADLNKFHIPIPPLREQRRIGTFLDYKVGKIDTLIGEQEKLLTLLAEKRRATILHTVTRGLNPDAPMKDSGVAWLGSVPAHWTVKRLKMISPSITVGIVVNPSDYVSDEGLPFIYGGDISEGKISLDSCRRIMPEDSDRQTKTKLEAGDLLTVRVGAPGVTAVVPETCVGGNCASVMLVRKGDFDSEWLCYAMNSRMVRYQVEVVQYGAAQEQFNIGHAINFSIATPPRAEQASISKFLNEKTGRLDNLKYAAERTIGLLKERRRALIAAAITGKIDVREHVTVLEAAA